MKLQGIVTKLLEAKAEADTRQILDPQRDASTGLFVQPKDVGEAREAVEEHNRTRFANHFNYADPAAGNVKSFDPKGDYNCGRCNQADGNGCLLLKIKQIDPKAGSCEDWEQIDKKDAEMVLHEKLPAAANYGVAKNGQGFGCHRCPFASKAIQPDSQGRSLYCGKGDFRVHEYACCALNGAPTVGDENHQK